MKLILSEVAVLIGAFAMGPLAGVMIEAIKIILKPAD
jgi:riboflavin transporter FmnP